MANFILRKAEPNDVSDILRMIKVNTIRFLFRFNVYDDYRVFRDFLNNRLMFLSLTFYLSLC